MIETTDDTLLNGKVALRQPARGHRAGTDAVLLAAASGIASGDRVLDIGAATGAVGLMAATRCQRRFRLCRARPRARRVVRL